ncbi:MAG TPA: CDP-2,3-bis-(O-geranylgeranyl)-sn-glycerol synthase [Candidatus Methanomethylia archaeon]|nr:CDP-2,3-bis-(O-geranylgeranyl)-sn-glycerol synthase [Candidatus Methanomethylicia archaeon]
MEELPSYAWTALHIAVAAYIANATPLLVKGKTPIDLGRMFIDGRRLLGNGKTVEGFAAGVLTGGIAGTLITGNPAFGFLASLGAMIGDLAGSFIKRRLGIPRGHCFPLLDQLDFILGALALTAPVHPIEPYAAIILLVATPPIHLAANAVAYKLKIKDTPC